jgi:hypothetical protein
MSVALDALRRELYAIRPLLVAALDQFSPAPAAIVTAVAAALALQFRSDRASRPSATLEHVLDAAIDLCADWLMPDVLASMLMDLSGDAISQVVGLSGPEGPDGRRAVGDGVCVSPGRAAETTLLCRVPQSRFARIGAGSSCPPKDAKRRHVTMLTNISTGLLAGSPLVSLVLKLGLSSAVLGDVHL